MRPRRQAGNRTGSAGFTLIELLVVMAIIGILITFLLIAAGDGIRRAEEKATLALITKLDLGIAERIEAVLLQRANIAPSHVDLAAIYATNQTIGNTVGTQRAQTLAQFDLFKAEVPDVFLVANTVVSGHTYPFNFAAAPYLGLTQNPPGSGTSTNFPWGVPLGSVYGSVNPANPTIGMFGATYQSAGALYKGLGYLPAGYDGADNDGDGFIDDLKEGIGNDPLVPDPASPASTLHLSALISRRLSAHTHNTARSEMLYALVVNGVGPLGSVFAADDFTAREVGDTDGDGMLEFLDAWGQPLQFYRWPIAYNIEPSGSGNAYSPVYIQKGTETYNGITEPRQVDPLDPNQMLVSISWWANSVNSSPPAALAPYQGAAYSAGAGAFMTHFHSLLDPNFATAGAGQVWDRSGAFARRAYYSRFLILSGGPDKTPGTGILDPTGTAHNHLNTGLAINALNLISAENNAILVPPPPASLLLAVDEFITDDITNQGLASPGGGIR